MERPHGEGGALRFHNKELKKPATMRIEASDV